MQLLNLFWSFFKIGFFTFGGGLAMMPFIEDEFINKKRWIAEEDMTEMVALSQSFPGVIAINISILTGYKIAGFKGAITATVATILPALLSIILILVCLQQFEQNKYIQMFFLGIKATSATLIFCVVRRLAKRTIKNFFSGVTAAIGFSIVLFNFSAAWSILIGIFAGIVLMFLPDNISILKNKK